MKKVMYWVVVLVFLLALPARAATFPYANYSVPAGEFTTALVASNFTADALELDPWKGFGVGGAPLTVAPLTTVRVERYPFAGSGLFDIDADPRLAVYVEVKFVTGVVVRIPSLTKVFGPAGNNSDCRQSPAFLDLLNDGAEWRSFVWLSSKEGAAVRVQGFHGSALVQEDTYILAPGDTRAVPVPAGADSVRLIEGIQFGAPGIPTGGSLFAFAYASRQPRGEVLPIISPVGCHAWAQSTATGADAVPTARRRAIVRPPSWSIARTSPGSPLDPEYFAYLRLRYTQADELDVYQRGESRLARLDGSQPVADIPVMLRCDGTVGAFTVTSWRAGWKIADESREFISIPPTC